ncbi:hypothetical protein [Spongiimicrobium sp. 3-5]|uniref:hypothetical protein n=1 Tax=Spongiimicrobium sp. 3-5 TaxID=3332596 RepID=UPI00397FA04F
MMDELEFLKKDWQKKEAQLPKLSYEDIYKMILKKSSSIVKWIFYISVIEFILPHLLYLLPSARGSMEIYQKLGLQGFLVALSIFQYTVVFFFIYQFYKRYKEISVLDNAKNLMHKIIKTRRTVKHYIIFSLSLILISFALFVVGIYLSDDLNASLGISFEIIEQIPPQKLKMMLMLIMSVSGVIITALVGGIYFLLYGLLLRKLNDNYNELKRLE